MENSNSYPNVDSILDSIGSTAPRATAPTTPATNPKPRFDESKLTVHKRWEISDDDLPGNKYGTAITIQTYDNNTPMVKISRYGTAEKTSYEKGIKISALRPEVLKEVGQLLISIGDNIETGKVKFNK